jgi:hypothetical protein
MYSQDSLVIVKGRFSGRYAMVVIGAICGIAAVYGSKRWFAYIDHVIKGEICNSAFGDLSVGGLYAVGLMAMALLTVAALGLFFILQGRDMIKNKANIPPGKQPLFDTRLIEGNKAVTLDRQNVVVGVLCVLVFGVLLVWPFRVVTDYFVVSPSKIERCIHSDLIPAEKK